MIDEIDRKIIRTLLNDGRISFRDLGGQIHLSANATAERVRRLQTLGVIKGFRASLDLSRLGLNLTAYIDVKLPRNTAARDFEAGVTKLLGVTSVAILTGSYDIRLRVTCRNQQDLMELIETLRTRFGARETTSSVVCQEIEDCKLPI